MMCCNNCGWLRWVTTTNTAYYCEFNGKPLSDLKDCCQAWKSTIQTNADRIRAMTDEKLARYLDGVKRSTYNCTMPCNGETCVKCWLDWLKEEVEE